MTANPLQAQTRVGSTGPRCGRRPKQRPSCDPMSFRKQRQHATRSHSILENDLDLPPLPMIDLKRGAQEKDYGGLRRDC